MALYSLACGVVGVAGLLLARGKIQGTTLVWPWAWTVAAIAAVTLCEAVIGVVDHAAGVGWAPALRYAAALVTLCPFISLLGARRPHDGAWQFIVGCFWLVFVLPAVTTVLAGRSQSLDLHAVWGWFLWLLILGGAVNMLATRSWLSAAATAVAQALLLAPQLPPAGGELNATGRGVALTLVAAAPLLAWIACRRTDLNVAPWNRAWLDFRDLFGVAWSLRAMERFNTAARLAGWDCNLGWFGFNAAAEDSAVVLHGPAQTAFVNVLRRFVSPKWLKERGIAEPT